MSANNNNNLNTPSNNSNSRSMRRKARTEPRQRKPLETFDSIHHTFSSIVSSNIENQQKIGKAHLIQIEFKNN